MLSLSSVANRLRCWKLRAVVSLTRLWQRQGALAEARELFASISGW